MGTETECSHLQLRCTRRRYSEKCPPPFRRNRDVPVGDRAFGTFAHLCLLASRGPHAVFRMSRRRVVDFTPGRQPPPRWNTCRLSGKARARRVRTLGPTDQVVEWYKPYQRPAWMSAEEYVRLPVTLPGPRDPVRGEPAVSGAE